MPAWIYLLCAILLEVAGTTCMKLSDGFANLLPSVLIFVFYAGAFTGLTLAFKQLDVSLAYAIWAGLGTVLIAAIGAIFFREPMTLLRIGCIGLVVIGVVGLNFTA